MLRLNECHAPTSLASVGLFLIGSGKQASITNNTAVVPFLGS